MKTQLIHSKQLYRAAVNILAMDKSIEERITNAIFEISILKPETSLDPSLHDRHNDLLSRATSKNMETKDFILTLDSSEISSITEEIISIFEAICTLDND